MKPLVVLALLTFVVGLDLIVFVVTNKSYELCTSLTHSSLRSGQLTGGIHLKTFNPFTTTKVTVDMRVTNQFNGSMLEQTFVFLSKKTASINYDVQIESQYSGNIEYSATAVTFTDLLGLVSVKGTGNTVSSSCMLSPKSYDMTISMPNYQAITEYGEQLTPRKNVEQGEVVEFKPYEIGDPIKQIHWKLSMKEQALMIKEMSEETSQRQLILLETNHLKEQVAPYDVLETLLTTFVSISQALIASNQVFSIGWHSQSRHGFVIETVSSAEQLGLIEACIKDMSYQKNKYLVKDSLNELNIHSHFSRILYLYPSDTEKVEIPDSLADIQCIEIGETTNETHHHVSSTDNQSDLNHLTI